MNKHDDLFDLFNDFFKNSSFFNSMEEYSFPKDDDPNFNKTTEESETKTHIIVTETWTSINDGQTYIRVSSRSKLKSPIQSIEGLKSELNIALEAENYEKAAEIRDQIKKIESEN